MALETSGFVKSGRAAIVHSLNERITKALNSITFEEALHSIALEARLVVGAHQCALSFVPDGDFHTAIHTHSFSTKYERYNTYDVMPTGEGIWGVIVERRIPMRMTEEEILSHPRWKNFSGHKDARGLEHPPMPGWLAVPILWRNEGFLGVLQLSDKFEGEFTENDQELLTHVGSLIAPTFKLQFVSGELRGRTEEICRLNEELEQRVKELAASSAASQAKSEFLAHVSHELRTPLNAAMGFAHLLTEPAFGKLNVKQQRFLGNIIDSGSHLLQLINDLIDVSKIEARKMELEVSSLDVRECLSSCCSIASEMAANKEITFKTKYPPKGTVILGDESKIKQIVVNLLSNAVKFTLEGGKVSLRAATVGDELRISVTDTGIGIDPQYHEQIFDLFDQGSPQVARKYGGSGLGLPLVKELVELHGGRVWLKSAEGKGSTFTVALPLTRSRQPGGEESNDGANPSSR